MVAVEQKVLNFRETTYVARSTWLPSPAAAGEGLGMGAFRVLLGVNGLCAASGY